MIVLDTNVLSEMMRPRPAETVIEWVAGRPAAELFTTTVNEAEILYGLALLPDGRRQAALQSAAVEMFEQDFLGRVLPFDSAAAHAFAAIAASRRVAGRPIAQLDAQIAAIARSRGATLATRNVSDFKGCGLSLIDPWRG